MAKEDNASKEEAWTTWEELLLACAVKRHGFKNWDSVAMEIQTRTSLSHLCISPQNCKLKYQDLKRRFAKTEDNSDTIPWLDELKKLRVAELRQEVHRSDVSIQSLQLKVKRLKEEGENENDDEKPDLEMDPKKERSESDKNEINGEPEKSSDRVAGKSDESDRENQSVNASNSTGGTKGENQEVGPEDERKESRPVQNNCREADRVSGGSKPVGEDSYNASSDSIAKDLKLEVKKSELGNSVGESKRGEDEGKRESQSSDVQSSASLMKKKHRKEKVAGGNSGEELASIKRMTVKSRPLVEILEIIRSHKHGSLFERRLQSQETSKYKKLIRQHMDLQTVQKRLDKGSYSSSTLRFYRDLLVLFNNAIIFFPKSSIESVTARELRNIVSNEMMMIKQNPTSTDSSPEVNTNPSPPIMPQQLKSKLERSDSLLPQDKSSGPIIVCRKRSSIAAAKKGGDEQNKPSSAAVKSSPPKLVEEEEEEEEQVAIVKMKKKDTTVTGARSMRKINNKNQSTSPEKVDSGSNSKAEKKKSETTTSVLGGKKRSSSAADFLKRIKQNSPSEKWRKSSEDDFKNSPEKKKRSHDKKVVVDGRKDREVRSNGKQGKGREEVRPNGKQGKEKEETSPSKRGVGRPPRKGADVVPVKRKRENGSREVEVEDPVASSKRPKKKTRR